MNMISTGAFLPEMDASNKQETMAEKFARVWEKKNSKVARAGGVSLMALSLAACGSSSDDTATTTPTTPTTPAEPTTPTVTPASLELSTAQNVFAADSFTTAADSVTGTGATLTATDVIAEGNTGDGDTLTISIAEGVAGTAPASVTGIENVVYNTSTFTVSALDVDNIFGATITVNNLQAGGVTGANVDNLSSTSDVVFGAGVTGTADVALAAGSDSTISAGSAAQLDVANITNGGASIVAGDDTNIIEVEGTTATTDAVSISGAGAVALDTNDANGGTTDQVEILTLSGNGAAATYTLNQGDAPETITFAGTQDVTLVGDAADFDTETVANTSTGTATLQINNDATSNLDLVATSVLIDIADTSNGSQTFTVANNANVQLSAAGVITFDSDELTTGDETINLTINIDGTGSAVDVSDFEVVNLATTTPTGGLGADSLLNAEIVAGTTSVITLTGATALEIDTATVADELNAAAYTGDITMTVTAANLDELTFGEGDDTITVASTETATLVGGDGTDTLVAGADMDGFTFSGFEVLDATANITNLDASQIATAMVIHSGTVTVDLADLTTLDFSIHTVDSNVAFTFDGTLDTTTFASTQGLTVIGNINGDTLNGTANADTITGGEGGDGIDGAAGADTIILTETTAATDTVTIDVQTDSLEAAYDSITGFSATATAGDILAIGSAALTTTARTIADASAQTTETDTGTVTASMSTTGLVTVGGTSAENVNTLAEWIDVTEALISAELLAVDTQNTTVTALFEFDGNTYVVQGTDTSVTGGTAITYVQEAVVELVGLTGITGLNATAADNVIDIA